MSAFQKQRYFFCQLRKDFFKEHPLDVIRGMEGGREALLLYVELLLDSAGHEGHLLFDDGIPYTPELISAKFNTPIDVINKSFEILKLTRLVIVDNGEILLTKFGEYVGSKTNYADQMAEKRSGLTSCKQLGDNRRTTKGQQADDKKTTADNNVVNSIRDKSTEKRVKNKDGGGYSRATAAAADLVTEEKIDQTIKRLNATAGMNITAEEATGFKRYVAIRNSNPDAPPNAFVTRQNFQTTLNAWLDIERKQKAEKCHEAKAEAEKKAEEERLEEIRQRRLLDENGRDD